MYVIGDRKNNYITRNGNNRYATSNEQEAEVFATASKADNVRLSLGKSIRTGHNWQVLSLERVNPQYIEVNLEELKDKIKDAAEILSTIKGNKSYLSDMLSNVDLEISDIVHYIENYNFSASEGYKLAKGIKEARERRRDIKRQMMVIELIEGSTGTSIANGHLSKKLDDIDNWQYTPRVLKELFESRNTQ